MTRLDLARALVRPIGGYAIIAAMIGLVAAIVIATFTDFDATIAAGALVPVCGLFGYIYQQRGREQRATQDTPRYPE